MVIFFHRAFCIVFNSTSCSYMSSSTHTDGGPCPRQFPLEFSTLRDLWQFTWWISWSEVSIHGGFVCWVNLWILGLLTDGVRSENFCGPWCPKFVCRRCLRGEAARVKNPPPQAAYISYYDMFVNDLIPISNLFNFKYELCKPRALWYVIVLPIPGSELGQLALGTIFQ